MLSSQPGSFVASRAGWNGPSQAGPKPGCLNPASPSRANLRIWVPPWDKEEEGGRQAGRKEFGIFWSANGVSLGWLLTTLGNIAPHNMKLTDRAIQMDRVC